MESCPLSYFSYGARELSDKVSSLSFCFPAFEEDYPEDFLKEGEERLQQTEERHKERVRRDSYTETKYIELIIVADSKEVRYMTSLLANNSLYHSCQKPPGKVTSFYKNHNNDKYQSLYFCKLFSCILSTKYER